MGFVRNKLARYFTELLFLFLKIFHSFLNSGEKRESSTLLRTTLRKYQGRCISAVSSNVRTSFSRQSKEADGVKNA